ncbi:AAA family ATPase [Arcobacter lanthieri]|uniref:AAA family ATPase n=1 Tax=Aliarcobacter lanthieri TaxID=1355374 RepID=UPI00192385AA|nr:AAA family ATPase [Aliarcobacter lanthieri]MBL3518894.1 AAA family ATPase [Aliarcobacter lanthieri]
MKIKIKNFRSFKDMDHIDIKPITILIGRNSSGKSSFLRTFPMLKQSFEEKTRSPILLYGNYIDFGTYEDIKPNFNNEEDKDNYELGFVFDKNIFDEVKRYSYRLDYGNRSNFIYKKNELFEIRLNIIFEKDKKDLLSIKQMQYGLGNNNIILELNHSENKLVKLLINNEEIINQKDNIKFFDRDDFVFDFYKNSDERRIGFEKIITEKIRDLVIKITNTYSVLNRDILKKKSNIEEMISKFLGNVNPDDIRQIIDKIDKNKLGELIDSKEKDLLEDIIIKIQSIKIIDDEEILKKLNEEIFKSSKITLTKYTKEFIELKNLIVLYNFIDKFILPISIYFKQTFLNVKYIAPLRATAERYYRIQHLSVKEVDQNGTNLPSFLDSLNEIQIKEFQDWTKKNFDFFVTISKLGGHYSIKVSLVDGIEINLSDMGFGYSQILPVLTQLWYSSTKYDINRRIGANNYQKIIVIEQPELHLHPEFQGRFTNMLAQVLKYSKNNDIDLRIIIETHSDVIINTLGDLIIKEEINHEQINIIIFDKKSEEQPTNVKIANYDVEGNLINWPLGFFQPSL